MMAVSAPFSRWIDSFPVVSRPFSDSIGYCPGTLSQRGWRLSLFYISITVICGLLTVRSLELQVFRGREFLAFSEGNSIRPQVIWPERGIIFDRSGKVITRNRWGYRLAINLTRLPQNYEEHLDKIALLLDLEAPLLREKVNLGLNENLRQVTVSRGIGQEALIELEVAMRDWPEVVLEDEPVRDYPYGELLAHALGYVSEASKEDLSFLEGDLYEGEKIGKTGLEAYYDDVLRGKIGARLVETSALGDSERVVAEKKPTSGKNLLTTLDLGLQEISFSALNQAIEDYHGLGGAVVAQKTATGEVLVLISAPSFDPNIFSFFAPENEDAVFDLFVDQSTPLQNRALSGLYPPGSIFKLVTASAVLEEGVVTEDTVIDDPGYISVGSFRFGDWKPGGHGMISIVRAIAESCDTYFYTVGGGYNSQLGLGADRLASWARSCGYGAQTKIDLSSELSGLIPDPEWKERVLGEAWYIGNTYHMAIGQGDVLTTPLQVNNFTTYIANESYLWEPYLGAKALAEDGFVIWEHVPQALKSNMISSETLSLVRQGMHEATEPGGTAYYAFQKASYSSAGKTGTSEYGDLLEAKTHAWYTVFAPYENPQISLTVLVEGGGEGSVAAALAAREILDWYFSNSNE